MSLDLFNEQSRLHPLYSDMEHSDMENRLRVPSPSFGRRRSKRRHSPARRRTRRSRISSQRHQHKRFSSSPRPPTHNRSPVSKSLPSTPRNQPHSRGYNTQRNLLSIPANQLTQTAAQTQPKLRHSRSYPNNASRRCTKRRIRTFYSKKWGNKLYGLTTPYQAPPSTPLSLHSLHTASLHTFLPSSPVLHAVPQPTPRAVGSSDDGMEDLWHLCEPSPSPSPQGSTHSSLYLEEHETLDLSDLNSLCSPSCSPSPSPLPMTPLMTPLMTNDFRLNDAVNYDSAVSNVAANTDIDEHEATQRFHTLSTPNNHVNVGESKFKIVVSAPVSDGCLRMCAKRNIPMYMPSDSDTASEDFSSSEDEDSANEDVMERSSLFLSDNNLVMGVYSDFDDGELSASDTDYMSAQSGDFDELTICYHDKKERNIKFRQHYLGDLGPSDMGSSDTDYLSSLESVPESVPDCGVAMCQPGVNRNMYQLSR